MAPAREVIRSATSRRSHAGKNKSAVAAVASQSIVLRSGSDSAEVRVSKGRFKQIADRKKTIGKLIAGYADIAAKAKRTGRTLQITYEVTPDGKAAALSAMPAEGAADSLLDAAIVRAKARGACKVAEILKGADMLTARDFATLLGASHETVNAKRKRDEVLGLEGATRGVRYPRWQLTDNGLPLPGLTQVSAALGRQPWTIFRFLLAQHAELNGRTALDTLKSGQVDAVVGVAENLSSGAFS